MKKHSEAGRINVGSVAMSACYARVELADRPVTNQSPLPSALIATPADGPPASGETNTMLERAFSVHVTGRPPIDVKGKGRLEMFWADPVVRPAVVYSPGPRPGYPAHGTPVPSQIRLSPEMQVRLGPAGEGPHVAGSPPLGTHARELGSIAGLNAVANESFRVRETQTRELGTRRTVLPVRRMTAVAEGTVAAAVGTPLLPARLPSSLASSAAATPAGYLSIRSAAPEIVRIARAAGEVTPTVAVAASSTPSVGDREGSEYALVSSDAHKRVGTRS